MARTGSQSGPPDPVSWRGAVAPDDPWGDVDPFDDEAHDPEALEADALAHEANLRSRRTRRWAILGGAGLLLAATIVTGTGGADDTPAPTPPATTVVDPEPDDSADLEAGVEQPVLTLDPIEGGLRYGGMGGGADIRSASGRTDTPFETAWVPPRLPEAIDPVWTYALDLDPAAASRSRDALLGAVDIGVGDASVIVVSGADRATVSVTALDPVDGSLVWTTTAGAAPGRLIGIAEGLVGVQVGSPAERSVLLFDELDGSPVAQNVPRVAQAQVELFERRAGGREVRPDVVAARSFVASSGAGVLVEEMAVALTLGTATIIAADEVAQGRLVVLVGDDLVGVRTADGVRFGDSDPGESLVVDWVRPGVLLLASPSDRGATLLVSNRRGTQQQVVDAATGLVVTELANVSSSISVYTPTRNGVVVKLPAIVGSELVAVDLDGQPVWRLLGSPPFGVGDELVVTASVGPDGLVVTGRR